jgi:adenine-specific DNA methylase
MAKKQPAPDQLDFPGVELDAQGKLGFAKPGGGREQKPAKTNGQAKLDEEHLPPNLAKPVKVRVPDFSNPKRPKTCLEVDFPVMPINALSALEGNAGKPIYQMSKWWARRRSCVFRAMLIAAAMEAPLRKNPDGSPVLDDQGLPEFDEPEAAKAVWDVYYANHQAAESFKHLKVLDCFMGGGTTLVEGSRLGFQVSGVDLNPVAWFVVKNELACTDPEEVRRFFDEIEAEVKPVIQPFYVTDCPRGHKGKWYEIASPRPLGEGQGVRAACPSADDRLMPADFDPLALPPDEQKKYRYEGPEIIYTFWAKHGPCSKPGCGHRTPIFRSPVIAEKTLGVKYIELKCKSCKTVFHAELGDARMAPAAEHIVLPNEPPFTALSQPFAQRLLEYGEGNKGEKMLRAGELSEMVETEPGLQCPKCKEFAGQFLRDVLTAHRRAARAADIDKKHLKIQPARNSMKPVYCYLLIHPDWVKGSPGTIDGQDFGGYADAPVDATACWYEERLKGLRLVEIRGRIKLSEDTSILEATDNQAADADAVDQSSAAEDETEEPAEDTADRKQYGLPRFLALADGQRLDTRRSTIPKQSHFACGACGMSQDIRESVEATQRGAPMATYVVQGYCPACDVQRQIYNGRFFAEPAREEVARLIRAECEWHQRRDGDLRDFWPRGELPETYMTHHANFALPKQGYTHWWKMFNTRQLLVHSQLLRAASDGSAHAADVRHQALGAIQQYLRNQNGFVIWNIQADKVEPSFSNPNYAPKALPVENTVFGALGRGSWVSTASGIVEGLDWSRVPWEVAPPDHREETGNARITLDDPVLPGADIRCMSSSDLSGYQDSLFDLVITDPPFGDNIFYSDLANFFYAWLRLPLRKEYPDLFDAVKTPNAQEALAPRLLPEAEANEYYRVRLTACWAEAFRVLKDGGLLAFTFHHSEDSQWALVLQSLFESGFYLEQTYPIASDEMKGEGGQFGAKGTEYDMIHVCRKRLEAPAPVSWPKMRQWVKAELKRLRRLLDSYKTRELSDADIRTILRGKALEFYSRHYGQVFTSENEPLSIGHALLGINQLLDEDTAQVGERPPSVVQPLAYQFLRLFGSHESLGRDEVGKNLRGTGIVQRELEQKGWIKEEDKTVRRVPVQERFEKARQRPRKEMKTEIDQAHFLIGAAMPGSGVNVEEELMRDTWMIRRSVEAVLDWYAKTALEPEVQKAATLAGDILRRTLQQNRAKLEEQQGFLFDDLYEEN